MTTLAPRWRSGLLGSLLLFDVLDQQASDEVNRRDGLCVWLVNHGLGVHEGSVASTNEARESVNALNAVSYPQEP